jgi:hypothetical protein
MRNKNKPDRLIRIPAAISKEDLEHVAPLYGATNAGQFAGNPPGTLRLQTFAGRYSPSTGKFLGDYRFEPTDEEGGEVYWNLPGVPDEAPIKRGRKTVELHPAQAAAESEEVTHG